MKKCDIVAIIPARYASTRLPGKPLQLISGKPMVQWVYERTAQCPKLTKVIVATDDQRIIDCVQGFGGEAVLSDSECATGTDRIADAANHLGLSDDALLLNVQGDQPLVNPQSLSNLVTDFTQGDNFLNEMGTLGFAMPYEEAQDPGVVKVVMDSRNYALYFSRHGIPYGRDEQVAELITHLGVYIYSHQFVKSFNQLPQSYLEDVEKLEQLRILEHGYKIKMIMSDYDSPEVDTPKDVEKVEAFIKQNKF